MNYERAARVSAKLSRPRPKCREQLVRLGLRPLIVNGEWNGDAIDGEGRRVGLSNGMYKELRRMVVEGLFPTTTVASTDSPADSLRPVVTGTRGRLL